MFHIYIWYKTYTYMIQKKVFFFYDLMSKYFASQWCMTIYILHTYIHTTHDEQIYVYARIDRKAIREFICVKLICWLLDIIDWLLILRSTEIFLLQCTVFISYYAYKYNIPNVLLMTIKWTWRENERNVTTRNIIKLQ